MPFHWHTECAFCWSIKVDGLSSKSPCGVAFVCHFGRARVWRWSCTSGPAIACHIGMQSPDAPRRAFGFRCRCRDGESAFPIASAHLHGVRAVFLLGSCGIVPPAVSRERETRRVRNPLLSSPGSKLLRRFRSRSLMKSVSIDTSCTHESYIDEFDYCGSHGALRCA